MMSIYLSIGICSVASGRLLKVGLDVTRVNEDSLLGFSATAKIARYGVL